MTIPTKPLIALVAIAGLAIAVCGFQQGSPSLTPSPRCSDFRTRAEASAALRAGATRLDGDHDGIPCETLP